MRTTVKLKLPFIPLSDGDLESRVVCDNLSDLSPTELDKVLKKVKIDLSKTAEEDEEERF
jgi:hypothetical protein